MSLKIGDIAPDFHAETTEGPISFHDWIGDSWAVLFSHPKDFTPVCTTELGYMAKIKPEFDKRNVKLIGLSVDSTGDHEGWAKDIEETQGHAPNYPIIGDADFSVSKLYGMLGADVSGDPADRTAMDNQTVRNVFVVGPDKKVKLVLIYPMTTGRNFDEVLRVIDSLQLTAKHRVATPVNWQHGDDVIIAGSVSNDEAKEIFGEWDSPKPYIRIVPQPDLTTADAERAPSLCESPGNGAFRVHRHPMRPPYRGSRQAHERGSTIRDSHGSMRDRSRSVVRRGGARRRTAWRGRRSERRRGSAVPSDAKTKAVEDRGAIRPTVRGCAWQPGGGDKPTAGDDGMPAGRRRADVRRSRRARESSMPEVKAPRASSPSLGLRKSTTTPKHRAGCFVASVDRDRPRRGCAATGGSRAAGRPPA